MITYDAIVVGSGITGGWAAKELTEKGLRTLMIERGRDVVHRKDYITEHKPSWDLPLRDARLSVGTKGAEEYPIQARTGQFREANKHFFIKDTKSPYIEDKPFTWIQGDQVGGKSLIWGRQVYRWSDLDFEANLRDGHGVDWPLRYADIAPWYSYVERFIGVSGEKLGLPQLPDGEFQPPMEMNAGEKLVKTGVERAFPDRHVTIGRVAILTQPLNGRLPCHYCGPCERGCSTGSYFSTQASTLPAAQATRRLTVLPNSIVHSVIYDAGKNRVTGVRVVDTVTKQTRTISWTITSWRARAEASRACSTTTTRATGRTGSTSPASATWGTTPRAASMCVASATRAAPVARDGGAAAASAGSAWS